MEIWQKFGGNVGRLNLAEISAEMPAVKFGGNFDLILFAVISILHVYFITASPEIIWIQFPIFARRLAKDSRLW